MSVRVDTTLLNTLIGAGPGYTDTRLLVAALESGDVVDMMYDGKYRVVEIHAIGRSTAGKLVMRGYQIGGQASRPLPQWTLFDIAKIENLERSAKRSQGPREGYTMGDRQMADIFAELAI